MQKSSSRKYVVSAILALGFALISSGAMFAASNNQLITFSGQEISSIFEGLKPSQFILDYLRRRNRAQREKWFLDERTGGARLGAHLVLAQCGNCPSDTQCADHYQVLHNSSGCLDPLGACPLPLHNATTDTQNGTYSEGSYDSYCGLYCCEDAQECANP
jgi:hypothetical protein